MGTPSHLGHMDRVAATMPSQAHAGAAQEAPDIGQWEGQDVPLVRPSSCNVKRGNPSSRKYLPTLPALLNKTNPWRWTDKEEACFQELKRKISSTNCLGVPRPKGEIILVTDACDVGRGGTLYQWQELNPNELSHCVTAAVTALNYTLM